MPRPGIEPAPAYVGAVAPTWRAPWPKSWTRKDETESPEYKARDHKVVEGSGKNPPAADEAKSYTIKSGDTLSDIAQEQLGDANRWNEIYALNKDVIGDDPDVSHPARSSSSRRSGPAAGRARFAPPGGAG